MTHGEHTKTTAHTQSQEKCISCGCLVRGGGGSVTTTRWPAERATRNVSGVLDAHMLRRQAAAREGGEEESLLKMEGKATSLLAPAPPFLAPSARPLTHRALFVNERG